MAVLYPMPKFQALTSLGALASGYLLYTYAPGTTTPQSTYTDSTGNTANANPVVLDSRGEADVWFDGTKLYKLVLKTAAGVTVWTVDNVGNSSTGMYYLDSASGSVATNVSAYLNLMVKGLRRTFGAPMNEGDALTAWNNAYASGKIIEIDGEGSFLFSAAPTIITSNGFKTYGPGKRQAVLKLNSTNPLASAVGFFAIKNSAFHHLEGFEIDANNKADYALKWSAEINNSCGSSDLNYLYMCGALVTTEILADAGGGSPNDVSHITWNHVDLRSVGASGTPIHSQRRVSCANSNTNVASGGNIGSPGQISTYNHYHDNGIFRYANRPLFAGSGTYDFIIAGGAVVVDDAETEADGGFWHSLNTDTAGRTGQLISSLTNIRGSCAGATSVFHESERDLYMNNCGWAGNVVVGKTAGAGSPSAILKIGYNSFASGKDYSITSASNGVIELAAGSNNSLSPADAYLQDVSVRQISLRNEPSATKSADYTITVADSGIRQDISASLVVTLPSTVAGVSYTFRNTGTNGTVQITISPAAADKIQGNGLTAADNKDLVNTLATAKRGDTITIVGDGTDGWLIHRITGTWAREA